MNIRYFLLVLFFGSQLLLAQQEPQYSQYMFNRNAFNPACAGTRDVLSTVLLLRNQWTGLAGSPKTGTLTMDAPLKQKKIGLSFSLVNDELGPKKSIGIFGAYSYKVQIGNGFLSMGIRGGVYNYTFNFSSIDYKDPTEVINPAMTVQKTVPSADAGLYYYTGSWYAGASLTHLMASKISTGNGDAQLLSRHVFLTAGKGFLLSESFILNPSFVIKSANGITSLDLNLNAMLYNKLWLGISLRTDYGFVFLTQYNITEHFKLGYAYDVGLNAIGKLGGATHEIMLGYDLNIHKAKILSPRYL